MVAAGVGDAVGWVVADVVGSGAATVVVAFVVESAVDTVDPRVVVGDNVAGTGIAK